MVRRIVKPSTAVKASPPAVTVAQIPEPSIARRYIHRNVNGVDDFHLFDVARDTGMNILATGPTGPGKTTAFMAYAAERGLPFYAVPSNVALEPSQLFGKPWNDQGVWKWVDGGVTAIVRHGGLLLINEVNFLVDRVATVLFPLLDFRRSITLLDHQAETIRAHRPPNPVTGERCWCSLSEDECRSKWVLIAADMNEGYEGTRPLNKAFRNRFALQIEWGYLRSVEEKLVSSTQLLDLADQIRARAEQGEFRTPVSTNMLEEFESIASRFDVDFASKNFVNHFEVDERPAITAVMRTFDANLRRDIMLMKNKGKPEDDRSPQEAEQNDMQEDPFSFLDME